MLRKTKYKEGDFAPLFLPDNLKQMVEQRDKKEQPKEVEAKKAKLRRTKSARELETEAL